MDFILPYKGIHKGAIVDRQPQGTSGYMNNIRARDVLESRVRIGQRGGMDKWGAGTQIGSAEQPVVAMCSVTTVA